MVNTAPAAGHLVHQLLEGFSSILLLPTDSSAGVNKHLHDQQVHGRSKGPAPAHTFSPLVLFPDPLENCPEHRLSNVVSEFASCLCELAIATITQCHKPH